MSLLQQRVRNEEIARRMNVDERERQARKSRMEMVRLPLTDVEAAMCDWMPSGKMEKGRLKKSRNEGMLSALLAKHLKIQDV